MGDRVYAETICSILNKKFLSDENTKHFQIKEN